MNAVIPRLVRLQDRLTFGRDTDAVWRINPRTGFLDARAGLSWTGVRRYGDTLVLRRPEQVNSPGHLKTLCRLPAPEGHPAGNVDVFAANAKDLIVGYTGDQIDVEALDGYLRPVGPVTVFRPETIAKMVDIKTWARYCEDFDGCRHIRHSGAPPMTGTSLGYNALWYGPSVDAEIVGERDDGSPIGEWRGPSGPERYDVEHIVDPDCEIVQRLKVNTGFDPELLGGNHFAVCLLALNGRGAEQSELLRIVDSLDLPIDGDLARRLTRVTVQVPKMTADAKQWEVGVDTSLPLVDVPWDEQAAEASIFAWASEGSGGELEDVEDRTRGIARALRAIGRRKRINRERIVAGKKPIIEGKTVSPSTFARKTGTTVGKIKKSEREQDQDALTFDPTKARQGFLLVDASAPEDASSYELPLVRVNEGRLEVVKGAVREALQQLPDLDLPDTVRVRAQHVLEHYARMEAARDASHPHRETQTVTKQTIEIGFGRDNAKGLTKLGLPAFVPLTLTLDEIDGEKIRTKLSELQEIVGGLMEMLGAAKSEAEDMKTKMADMMSVEEATAKIDELKAALAEAEKALTEAKAAKEKASSSADAAKRQCDALEAELAPLRAEQFEHAKAKVLALGFAKDAVEAVADMAALRRLVVAEKVGERYAKVNDAKEYVVSDETVAAAFDGVWAVLSASEPTKQRDAAATVNDGRSSFDGFPRVATQRDNDTNQQPAASTADDLLADFG